MPKRTSVLLLASLLIAQCLAGEAYIIRKNRRTLEQADKAYAQIHPVRFTPPPERWRNLHRTASLLSGGGELNVVMLGDSIINDISRSAWDLVLHRRYPACRINKTTCVRGSTGCWWYKEPPRVRQYVLDFDPDLVIIGGISHRGDTDSIAEVISQIRSTADPDILLMTGAFGSVEPAKDDRWRRISDPDHHSDYRRNLEKLARDTDCAFLDMEHAWAKYVRRSPRDLDWYKRDVVHANEYGEQILGRILYQYLSLVPNVHPDNSETDPLVLEKLERFQDWKFGFMMHWGIYSQWGCIESWPLVEADKWARPDDLEAWTMRDKDFDRFFRDYVALNKTFDPRHFDPARWLDAAEDAGMQYLVFTTKHHDGFCLFDTEHTDYRTTHPSCPFHTDPNADVIEAVFDTFRKAGFGIGAYYSKSDWRHPGYWAPEWPHKDRNVNYDITEHPEKWAAFVDFTHNLVEELMADYGPVDILWLDGGQVRPPKQDINMPELAAMARTHQPGLIVVDRTVGGKYENYLTPEQKVPDKPLPYVWETCMTMGDQWSYKPDDKYKSTRELIHLLVNIVAKGGNFLLNVGPDSDGRLPAPALERMRRIGDWMRINSDAVYHTRPIAPYRTGNICLTRKADTVYAVCLAEEGQDTLPERIAVPAVTACDSVRLLGTDEPVHKRITGAGLELTIPQSVRQSPPCEHAWTFEVTAAQVAE